MSADESDEDGMDDTDADDADALRSDSERALLWNPVVLRGAIDMGLLSVAAAAGSAIDFWSMAVPAAGRSGAAPGEVGSALREANGVGLTSEDAAVPGACAEAATTAEAVMGCGVTPLSAAPAGVEVTSVAEGFDAALPNPNRAPTAVTPAFRRAIKLGDVARAAGSAVLVSTEPESSCVPDSEGVTAAAAAAGEIRRTATDGESTLFRPALAAAIASTSAADTEKAASVEDEGRDETARLDLPISSGVTAVDTGSVEVSICRAADDGTGETGVGATSPASAASFAFNTVASLAIAVSPASDRNRRRASDSSATESTETSSAPTPTTEAPDARFELMVDRMPRLDDGSSDIDRCDAARANEDRPAPRGALAVLTLLKALGIKERERCEANATVADASVVDAADSAVASVFLPSSAFSTSTVARSAAGAASSPFSASSASKTRMART